LTVLVGIVLAWNLALLTSPLEKAPYKLFVIASISLILASWLLIYAIPDFGWRANLFGMMVSFFTLAVPMILTWDALLDSSPIIKVNATSNRIERIMSAILISVVAGFFAIYQGSIMWTT